MIENPQILPIFEYKCPKCSQTIQSYLGNSAYCVICYHCNSVFNSYTGILKPTYTVNKKNQNKLNLPLGTKGKIKGITYVVIAYSLLKEKGYNYKWEEYTLYNPLHGFGTLSHYNGHWTFYTYLNELPQKKGAKETYLKNKTFLLFSRYNAVIEEVKGEFPYNLNFTEKTKIEEYIHPPYVLTLEKTNSEIAWYLGEYVSKEEMKTGFNLITNPKGIGMAQPFVSSFSKQSLISLSSIILLVFCSIQLYFYFQAKEELVFQKTYVFNESNSKKEIHTPSFDLKYGTKNAEIKIIANVSNNWVYANFTLINEKTGEAFNTDIEASYYYGYQDGESWTEGSNWNSQVISSIPEGRYYLVIYPECSQYYEIESKIEVTRDVPIYSNMIIAISILLLFPIGYFYRSNSFESNRWEESDFF